MNCEIEFLPVGEKSRPGDAIVVRYGEAHAYELMVVDGGNIDSGKALVEHVRAQFGINSIITDLVLTHPDGDHACGFREVLSALPVKNLWLHIPALSAAGARPYFADKRWTDKDLAKHLYDEYDVVSDIVKIALERQVTIHQPFAGENIGPFTVLSPTQHVYELLLPKFDRTPEPDQAAIEEAGLWIGKEPSFIKKFFEAAVAKVQTWIPESWEAERLKDGGITSATNESSVVLYGDFGPGRRVLLTGDAGVWGLTLAARFATATGRALQDFMFVQIPHHGSRRNVGPTILNELLGPIQPENSPSRFSAFVSAPKEDDTHPRKMVLNAFIRRGGRVCATQGHNKVFRAGFPLRQGYSPVEPLPFAPKVENYD